MNDTIMLKFATNTIFMGAVHAMKWVSKEVDSGAVGAVDGKAMIEDGIVRADGKTQTKCNSEVKVIENERGARRNGGEPGMGRRLSGSLVTSTNWMVRLEFALIKVVDVDGNMLVDDVLHATILNENFRNA